MKQKKDKTLGKTKIKLIYLYYTVIIILFILGITFSKYTSTISSETQVKASLFSFKVGEKENDNVTISLEDTVTNNADKKVIPGSEGKIDLEIDFSDMEVTTDYTITVDLANTKMPSNIKLYTSSSYDVEFSGYTNTANLRDTEKKILTIYWKWNYTEEDETEGWMNEDIQLVLKINVEQRTN